MAQDPVSTDVLFSRSALVLTELSMTDFRLFEQAVVRPAPQGTTVLTGPNGSGKTTVLEAVAFLGSQRSFRGAPREAMVRTGADRGYVRGELVEDGRKLTVETELTRGSGESRAQVNRQRARRADLAAAVPVTVFSPEDLAIIQGGPAGRRGLLDDAVASLDRRGAEAVEESERALRQRGALLRQAAGRVTPEVAATLDIWDARLAVAAEALVDARRALVVALAPLAARAYLALAGLRAQVTVALRYVCSWEGPLLDALVARRGEDLRRAATTVGPHRDDLSVELAGRDARVQASQGEQRCLALGLRLGIHELLTARLGRPPLLLLDDVFSELDPDRSRALLGQLPDGQSLLTTATPLPAGMEVAAQLDVRELRGVSAAESRGPRDPGPRPVRESLDAVVRHIAPRGAAEFAAIFGRWDELVGPAVAAHVRPLRATDEALVVAADHPAWATQVRALAPVLLRQIGEATGRVPARLEVVVRRT